MVRVQKLLWSINVNLSELSAEPGNMYISYIVCIEWARNKQDYFSVKLIFPSNPITSIQDHECRYRLCVAAGYVSHTWQLVQL